MSGKTLSNNRPTGLVTFSGSIALGGVLRGDNNLADADGLGTLRYQWLADGKVITGANSGSIALDKTLVGSRISLQIQYTDMAGNKESVSSSKNYLETSYDLSQPSSWISSHVLRSGGALYVKDNPLMTMQTVQLDFNGDGKEDIFTYDSYPLDIPTPNPPPSLFINNGTTLDKVAWNGPAMTDPHGVKILVGDFNGDGFQDLFSLTAIDPPFGAFPNLQDINCIIFTGPKITLAELSAYNGFWATGASGDIDNDGDLDILMFNFHVGANGVQNQLLWNDGRGNFRFDPNGIGNLQVDHAELHDVNRDGYLDLAIDRLDGKGRHVSVLWGNGADYALGKSVSFDLPSSYFVIDIAFADLTTDKLDELLVSGVDEHGVYWIRIFGSSDSGKSFQDISARTIDGNSTSSRFDHIKVEDLDGDGLLDIFSPDMADNIRWEWNGSKFARVANPIDAAAGLWLIPSANPIVTGDFEPPKVQVSSIGGISNNTAQIISGTIEVTDAGCTISIYDSALLLGTTDANASGLWTRAVTLPSTQGLHIVTAQATDAAGNLGTSSGAVYTLDTIAPSITISTPGITTNQTTQTITGILNVGDMGQTISVYDGSTLLGITHSNSIGIWSVSVALLPLLGEHTIIAAAFDTAGNLGISNTVSYTLSPAGVTAAGTAGNDVLIGFNAVFWGGLGNDAIKGISGVNTSVYSGSIDQYTVTKNAGIITVADSTTARDGTDTLTNIAQIKFTDTTLVFDLTSSQDALVYRLYQAAFARTPDNGGFRYWADVADRTGMSAISVADQFLAAPEFSQKYGNPNNVVYAEKMYGNVLGRTPDPGGLAYWAGQLDHGLARNQLLVEFATCPENVQLTGVHMSNGYWTV